MLQIDRTGQPHQPSTTLIYFQVYYWHTVTNKVTYEQPEGVEYVAATLPQQENAA